MYLGKDEVGLGKRESVEDVGRVLTRMVDVLIVRTFDPVILKGLADSCTIPVINALDDAEHPCQAFADFLTMQEHLGDITGKTLTYIGDGNNVAASLMLLAPKLGVHFRIACPDGYLPDPQVWARAAELAAEHGTKMERFSVPSEAAAGADAIYTDVWTSMGQEEEHARRMAAFTGYTVTAEIMQHAAPGAIALHCLPAHRGDEIADDVMEGPWSRVFAQAENRLHAQQAILAAVL
jgi:ornithine carbamoyltransferase